MNDIKKRWKLRSINDKTEVEFYPVFELTQSEDGKTTFDVASMADKDVECTRIEVSIPDGKGGRKELVFNYLDLFMFVYFCANEELRQQLQMRYERQVNYIPYNVTFNLDAEEKQSGTARRRIELPIDELTMAIARDEAMRIRGMPVRPNMPTVMTPKGPQITSKLPKGR